MENVKLSLWDIETGLLDLLAAREEADTPEAIEAVEQALAEYASREVAKVDNIRGFIRHCEMVAAAARQEAADQAARARMWEGRRDRVKAMVQTVMEATGQKRIEGRTGSLLMKGNGGLAPLVVTNPDQVPDECCKYVGWIGARGWAALQESADAHGWQPHDFQLERVVDNERVRDALKTACGWCGGKGFLNPDGSLNAFEGSDAAVTRLCAVCNGTGRAGVPGAYLGERGTHVEVR